MMSIVHILIAQSMADLRSAISFARFSAHLICVIVGLIDLICNLRFLLFKALIFKCIAIKHDHDDCDDYFLHHDNSFLFANQRFML